MQIWLDPCHEYEWANKGGVKPQSSANTQKISANQVIDGRLLMTNAHVIEDVPRFARDTIWAPPG